MGHTPWTCTTRGPGAGLLLMALEGRTQSASTAAAPAEPADPADDSDDSSMGGLACDSGREKGALPCLEWYTGHMNGARMF